MLAIFAVQVVAAIFGTASISIADWLYSVGRLRRTLHSLWIGCINAIICLPLVAWTANTFLGVGILSLTLVGITETMIFLWVYRTLSKQAPARTRTDRESTPDPPAQVRPN